LWKNLRRGVILRPKSDMREAILMKDEECRDGVLRVEDPATPPAVNFEEFPPASYDEWKAAAEETLKGAPFEKSLFTRTFEGITLEPLYTPENTPRPGSADTFPGFEPMLRGASPAGYFSSPWVIAQESPADDPKLANGAILKELEKGATAITLRLDGCDWGVREAETLLGGANLAKYPFHIYAGASSLKTLKSFTEAASRLGFPASDLSGCIGADPFGAYLERGTLPRGIGELFDDSASAIRRAGEEYPKLRAVLLRGSVYHNGGANAVQEVAYVMACAIEFVRAMQNRGLDVEDFARSTRFEFSIGSNFFMEIAKIRAARVVWSRIAEAFSGDEDSRRAEIFGRTSHFTKTVYDPYVNLLRNATEAFSAVIGGVDGLTVCPFDEAVRPADEFARRVARNSQIMLQEEFHLLRPVDPAGGSWYVESLTDSLVQKIWNTIRDVESRGGMLACIGDGSVQSAVGKILEERFKRLALRSDRAVGINMYANTAETPLAKPAAANAPDGTDVTPIAPHRWTEQFEEMRTRTEDYKARTGDNVRIFLANMGPVSQHKARADFITGFMEVANFEILNNDGFASPEECAAAAAESGADIAVICSTDAAYPELAPLVCRKIKEARSTMKVLLAGAPDAKFKQSYLDAGVDDFISVRSDCLATLCDIQRWKGMTA
jgi:methylmalonyl-CoA mutase